MLHKEFQTKYKKCFTEILPVKYQKLANEEWRAIKDEFKNDTIDFINKVTDWMKDLSTLLAKQKSIGILKFFSQRK